MSLLIARNLSTPCYPLQRIDRIIQLTPVSVN